MSLSSAISNALSGLTATTRATELVSTNISNKSVAGYARRELETSSRTYASGGIRIDGVQRMVNAGLLADNRLAQAASSQSGTVAAFHAAIEGAYGTADDPGALTSLLTGFNAALTSAAARPDSDTRLGAVLDAASALTGKIRSVSATITTARAEADRTIGRDVDKLNGALEQVAELNRQITVLTARGEDASPLIDTRQAAIDEIASLVPIQEVARENGRIALFTKGGATLLDGNAPAKVSFQAANAMSTAMTVGNGDLSRLSLNGKPLSEAEMGMFAGGTIAANFQIRDDLAPQYQTRIDAFAREVCVRFADPAVDGTLAAGTAGMFTDAQSASNPAAEPGLANRIAVNAALDPAMGGALWRIREGVNATDPGSGGDATLIQAMGAALTDTRTPSSAAMSSSTRSMLQFAADLTSGAATNRVRADASALQDQTRADSLNIMLLAQGVDTDTEMEALLSLEKAYAANAKVFQTVNGMLDEILRLT
ncbi:flagellar hook-associated protein FlgK [Paracoccus limosus]|uniref:Flagellar hook-associated protein 1 n=1 Tax=Paracoccus limosus TaxID=913252 RepID=A0A844H8N5_9RHOB|nr:flagellar hook-associated protein FlgK [Paracoccus limosus]MTH35711.1 flagellar hook-associated protein FlgK [Paracoccus limosus]